MWAAFPPPFPGKYLTVCVWALTCNQNANWKGSDFQQWILLYLMLSFFLCVCKRVLKDSGVYRWVEKAFLDVLDAELISAPPPQPHAPMTTVHRSPSPPFLSATALLPRAYLLSTSLLPYASHTSLLRGFLLYCPAPRLLINANKSVARLNIKRQRIEAQVGNGERKRTRETDRWAFRAKQHGWENSSRKCDGRVGDFAPLSSEHDYTWHRSSTSGQLTCFRVKERERKQGRERRWVDDGKKKDCSVLYGGYMAFSLIYCTAWWDLCRSSLTVTLYCICTFIIL